MMVEGIGRVLVVDDEAGVRNLLQRTLEDAGYSVVTAASGQEALDEMSEMNIEVALLDIKMPGMSGLEVLQQVTINCPDTCVIMVTAIGDAQTAVEAMKLGAYDYITKPFNPADVVPTIQRALQQRGVRREEEERRRRVEDRLREQSDRLQELFSELVETLAREHKLLYRLQDKQPRGGKPILTKLPPELQKPMSSVEEFRDALLRILKRS
jgi:putative two-component system response regulator